MHKRFFRGFTVVELLVVIVVIGIIASITVFSYRGVQTRANDGAVQDDLKKLGDALNIYNGEKGRYPLTLVELQTITNVKFSRSNYDTTTHAAAYCTESGTGVDMVVMGKSKSGRIFYVKNDDPIQKVPSGTTLNCNPYFTSLTYFYIHQTSTGWLSNF